MSTLSNRTGRVSPIAALVQTQHIRALVTRIADNIILEPRVDGKEPISAVLRAASHYGHADFVQILLQIGTDHNIPVGDGNLGNALHAAASQGHDVVVDILLAAGANPNFTIAIYGTVLIAACYYGHEAVVKKLIDKGANIDAQGGRYGNALWAALHRGHRDTVKALLSSGADVDALKLGGAALSAARDKRHIDTYDALSVHSARTV